MIPANANKWRCAKCGGECTLLKTLLPVECNGSMATNGFIDIASGACGGTEFLKIGEVKVEVPGSAAGL